MRTVLTLAGVKTEQGTLSAALIPAIAIVCFLAGSTVGNIVHNLPVRHGPVFVLLLIAASVAAVELLGGPGELKRVDIVLLSSAMDMANPALPKIGEESISLTFMTGTLSGIGGHLGLALVGVPVRARRGHGHAP